MKRELHYASVKKNIHITPGSTRRTHHLELDISQNPFAYQGGDSVAIFAKNDPRLVQRIIQLGLFSSRAEVENRKKERSSFESYLLEKADLQRASPKLIEAAKSKSGPSIRSQLEAMEKGEVVTVWELVSYADFREMEEQEFISLLKPLTPRFYSIASCARKNPLQLDLLVTLSTAQSIFSNEVTGSCSDYLCLRAFPQELITLSLHPAPRFALPSDGRPLIMVGPGTGIAPFRSFVQERFLDQRKDNWLFFGERHEKTDFYYQEELMEWQKRGFLKLTTAFSRDQEEKIYVQHRIWENRDEIWRWVKRGANIYICGEAKRMAKAVQATFERIFDEKVASGKFFFKELHKQGRLLFDVY